MSFQLLIGLLGTSCVIEAAIFSDVEIISSFGRIRGIKNSINGSVMYQFRNIPYALPPVGHLRFQKPVPHPPLRGVYDGTKFGPSCIQKISEFEKLYLDNFNVSEDCLQLNIYVPNTIVTLPRAVMIWIHGGGFTGGQGKLYDSTDIASTGNVIVVTINYRLGLFGFLSTEDEHYPGNYGLFDQLEAIKWTKRHIKSFGGDPNRITIFGESSGAISVSYLATSPLSKGLFNRVIMESGGDFSRRAVDRGMRRTTMSALKLMGCGDSSTITSDVKQCLINADAYLILNVSKEIYYRSKFLSVVFKDLYGPYVDGELVVGAPIDLLQNSSSESAEVFSSLDVMAGINSADGGMFLYFTDWYLTKSNKSINDGVPRDVLCKVLAPALVNQSYYSNKRVTDAICGAYTNLEGLEQQGRSIVDFGTDMYFGSPMKQILDMHLKLKRSGRSAYEYLFSSRSSFSWSHLPPWFHGANHFDEVPYVFGLKLFVPRYTSAAKRLSELMMTYWTNFAKTGNPNSAGTRNFWPPYSSGNGYMELNIDGSKAHHDLYSQRFAVWLETIPRIIADTNLPSSPFG